MVSPARTNPNDHGRIWKNQSRLALVENLRNGGLVTLSSFFLVLLGLPVLGLSQTASFSGAHDRIAVVHRLDLGNGELMPVPFTYTIGGSVPAPVTYNLTSDQPADLELTTDGSTWVTASISANITPAVLTISVNPTGLSAGAYQSLVEVNSDRGALIYGLTLTVTAGTPAGALTLSSSNLTFTGVAGGVAPNSQQLTVTATGNTSASAQTSEQTCASSNWLILSPKGTFTASQAATNFTVSVDQTGITAGTTCSGTISMTAGGSTQTVSVTLNVAATASALTLSSSALTFNAVAAASAPATQQLTVTSPASTSATAQTSEQSCASSNWLTLSPKGSFTASQTSTAFTVSVDQTGIAAGTSCQGTITMTSSTVTQTASVTLNVTATQGSGQGTPATRSTVTLSPIVSIASPTVGQPVTITATVQPDSGAGNPSGAVQFMDGGTLLGTTILANGQASITTTYFVSGTHTIIVSYAGDANFFPVSEQLTQLVNRLTATLSMTSSTSTSIFGGAVTLTAQLGPTAPTGVATPSNLVQFFDGNTLLGAVAPSSYTATLTVTTLTGGAHQITGAYTGDGSWNSARCPAVTVAVTIAATSTVLTAAPGNTGVILTASVYGPPVSVLPTGSIKFVDLENNALLGTAALPVGSATATFTISASQVSAAAGHMIAAQFSGDGNYAPSASDSLRVPSVASATGATSPALAPNELVSLYGSNLSTATFQSTTTPLPGLLGGDSLFVTDSAGVQRPAGLCLVSPGQINFLVPDGTAPGTGWVTLTGTSGSMMPIQVTIASVAPGLFTADGSGHGLAAAQVIRVSADGTQATEALTGPISLGTDTFYLVLFGTGIRGRDSLSNVTASVDGQALPVVYAGPQPQYPGLDQVNLLLPANLQGSGTVNVAVTVDGQSSNTVTVTFQ